jgi:predicted SprT family Zn-dependent metalloprotease
MKNALRPLFQKLNRIYFEGKLKCGLVWGVARSSRVKRSRRLGSYNPETDTITLHPVLDQASIPLYVLASVLHHEMCHAFVPSKKVRGRLCHHTQEFKKREKAFSHYQLANQWIKKNLKLLFRPPLKRSKTFTLSRPLQIALFESSAF